MRSQRDVRLSRRDGEVGARCAAGNAVGGADCREAIGAGCEPAAADPAVELERVRAGPALTGKVASH